MIKKVEEEGFVEKPRKFRDRKTYSAKDTLSPGEAKHPLRTPYKRDRNNFLVEDEEDYGMWEDGESSTDS